MAYLVPKEIIASNRFDLKNTDLTEVAVLGKNKVITENILSGATLSSTQNPT